MLLKYAEAYKQTYSSHIDTLKNKEQKSTEDDVEKQQGYYVLVTFCLLSFVNAWIWITWSPLTPYPMSLFWEDVTASEINELSSQFMYIYIYFIFPALYILHRYGLKVGLRIGASLNMIGSIIRFLGVGDYKTVFYGTFFNSLAQCFILSLPPKIASDWFREHERATATSVGVLANQLGSAAGLGFTAIFPSIQITTIWQLRMYIFIQCVVSVAAFVMTFVYIKQDRPYDSHPNTTGSHNKRTKQQKKSVALYTSSPQTVVDFVDRVQLRSEDAAVENIKIVHLNSSKLDLECCHNLNDTALHPGMNNEKPDMDFISSLRLITNSKSKIAFTIIYGVSVGVFYAIATLLNQFLDSMSVEEGGEDGESFSASSIVTETISSDSSTLSGFLGLVFILVGLAGSLWTGKLLDGGDKVTENDDEEEGADEDNNIYRKVMLDMLLGSIISCSCFFFLLRLFSREADEISSSSSSLNSGFIEIGVLMKNFLLSLSVAGAGFCLTAQMSVGFGEFMMESSTFCKLNLSFVLLTLHFHLVVEYGSALCYPANEAAVAGVLNVSAQIGGWILIVVGGYFMDTAQGKINATALVGCLLVSSLLLNYKIMYFGVREKSSR